MYPHWYTKKSFHLPWLMFLTRPFLFYKDRSRLFKSNIYLYKLPKKTRKNEKITFYAWYRNRDISKKRTPTSYLMRFFCFSVAGFHGRHRKSIIPNWKPPRQFRKFRSSAHVRLGPADRSILMLECAVSHHSETGEMDKRGTSFSESAFNMRWRISLRLIMNNI